MPSNTLFPHTLQLEIMRGSTGEAVPIYEEPVDIPCLMAHGERQVETEGGRVEIATSVAYCHPQAPDAPTGSRVTFQGKQYEVVRSQPWRFPGRPSIENVELLLR